MRPCGCDPAFLQRGFGPGRVVDVLGSSLEAMVVRSCRDSLFVVSGCYEMVDNFVFVFRGTRPADGTWHGHGFLDVHPSSLFEAVVTPITVRKQRWSRPDRSATQHSRPPDDLGRRFDGLIVAVTLFAVLHGAVGVHQVELPYQCRRPDDGPSIRTIQRWLAHAQHHAATIHQVLRWAAMERCEPRPETLFPRGLPPPVQQRKRRWRDPAGVSKLWQGFAMVLKAACSAKIPTATLLAEARGRWIALDPQRDA